MICNACGTAVEGGNRYCTQCGRTVEDPGERTIPRSSLSSVPNQVTSGSSAGEAVRNPSPVLVLAVAGVLAVFLLTLLIQNSHDVRVSILFVSVALPVWLVLSASSAVGGALSWFLLTHRTRAHQIITDVRDYLTTRPSPLPPPVVPAASPGVAAYQPAPTPSAPTAMFSSAGSPIGSYAPGPGGAARPQGSGGTGVGWWGLACFLMGWIGGLVGYLVLKDSNPARAKRVAIVGVIWSVVWLLVWILFLVSVSAALTPS